MVVFSYPLLLDLKEFSFLLVGFFNQCFIGLIFRYFVLLFRHFVCCSFIIFSCFCSLFNFSHLNNQSPMSISFSPILMFYCMIQVIRMPFWILSVRVSKIIKEIDKMRELYPCKYLNWNDKTHIFQNQNHKKIITMWNSLLY